MRAHPNVYAENLSGKGYRRKTTTLSSRDAEERVNRG